MTPAFTASQHNIQLKQQMNALVATLGKHYVAYYKGLAEITNSPKAALMLGQAMHWTRNVMEKHTGREGGKEGWFYKTTVEWYKETGLTVRELETARKILTDMGILHERRQGMPAKLWFRVDLDRLAHHLCDFANRAYRAWDWHDRVLKAILGKPVMFYVPFAWLADSATAGLYMSSLTGALLQSARDNTLLKDGWFHSAINTSLDSLAIGRYALENARAKLVAKNIIAEKREKKAQPRLLTQINLADLPALIALEASKINSKSKSDLQGSRNPTNKSAGKRETGVWENAEQDCGETQNRNAGKRGTCFAENSTLSYIKINTTNQQQQKGLFDVGQNTEHTALPTKKTLEEVFDQLIYPNNLVPEERGEVKKLIQRQQYHACRHQDVLDEWAGRLAAGTVNRNPIGYLRTLLEKERAGELIIEVGHKVKAKREERKAMIENRHTQPESRKPSRESVANGLTLLRDWRNSSGN